MNLEDLDPYTMRDTAEALEKWLPQIRYNLERNGMNKLTPADVCAVIEGGIIDRLRSQAFDVELKQQGLEA